MSTIIEPVRRCVVCRKSGDKSGLLRFVFSPAGAADAPGDLKRGICIDLAGSAPGRGAYCHPTAACAGSRNLIELLVRSLTAAEPRADRDGGSGARPPVERCLFLDLALQAVAACRGPGKPPVGEAGRRLEVLKGLVETMARKSGSFGNSPAGGRQPAAGTVPKLRL